MVAKNMGKCFELIVRDIVELEVLSILLWPLPIVEITNSKSKNRFHNNAFQENKTELESSC